MSQLCKACQFQESIKSGFVRGKQRYKCKGCGYYFTIKDGRNKYDNTIRSLVVRMYLNNCGFRRISHILNIPLTTCFSWIKKAGQIVDAMVKERKNDVEDIEILEMDELYTFIKKTSKKCEHREI